MDEIDVFAGVSDFCQNFTPDTSKLSVSKDCESSDCDAEALFMVKKKERAAGTRKTQTKNKEKKKIDPKNNNKKTTSKKSSKNNADENPSTNDHSVHVIVGANRPRCRRSKRLANGELSIEEYMRAQTAITLSIGNTPVTTNSQRGRARRKYVSKKASQANVVGLIDLAGPATPPLPPRSSAGKNTIFLDSDDECNFSLNGALNVADTSFDFENEEIGVKIKWGDEIDVVPQRKHQKFFDLMQLIAKKKNVEVKKILLNLNDKIIRPDDTIESINYNIAQFISGRILKNSANCVPIKKKDRNILKVKIQSNAFKKPLEVSIKKDQNFKILYVKCSEQLKIPCESIKLSFDGDPLILNETPNDLELEGGEVIDCRIKN